MHFALSVSLCASLGACVDRLIVEETAGSGSQSASGEEPGTDSRDDPDDDDRDAAGEVDSGDPDDSEDEDEDEDDEDEDEDEDDSPDCGGDPEDCDGDGIPDRRDPFPTDPDGPQRVESGVIYVNTRDALFVVDPSVSWAPEFVIDLETEGDPVTDIAIDRFDVLYAVTTTTLFVCTPDTGACTPIAGLSGVNAAGFGPDPANPNGDDALYLANATGDWYVARLEGASADVVRLGAYPDGAISAGDITEQAGLLIASIVRNGVPEVALIEPGTSNVVGSLPVLNVAELWGIAIWNERFVSFSPDGSIRDFEAVLHQDANAWWGAAGNEF